MKSMKMSDEEQSEYAQPSIMSGAPLYPWGLQITLDDEALQKLGLELPALDTVIEFRCFAQVTGINSRKESNDEDESSIQLQITDMEVVDSGKKDAASKLYGDKK